MTMHNETRSAYTACFESLLGPRTFLWTEQEKPSNKFPNLSGDGSVIWWCVYEQYASMLSRIIAYGGGLEAKKQWSSFGLWAGTLHPFCGT